MGSDGEPDAAPPPTTIPEAGGVGASVVKAFLVIAVGLLLILAGSWFGRVRKPVV